MHPKDVEYLLTLLLFILASLVMFFVATNGLTFEKLIERYNAQGSHQVR